jgi:hypothetical protein
MTEVLYFATFDGDGFPTGFFPDDVWPEDKRPTAAVELTEAQYIEFIEHQGQRKFVDGQVVAYTPLEPREA